MTIDYEKEYDNRARVPEHVDIFARWHSDAEAYRQASPKAKLGLKYGPGERQSIDIFPAKNATGPNDGAPLALFIHGGWWRTLHPREFSQLAAGPNAHGVTVAMAGYELCPAVSIATITDQMRAACLFLWRKYRQRIMVFGHSAGGHLAACMLATEWKALDASAPDDLVPAAYAISGVFDLTPLTGITPNADLKLDDASARAGSPILRPVPADRTLDCVVGGIESSEFLRQSRDMADKWGARGAATRYEEIPGANHFTVVDPLGDAESKMTRRVVELAKKVAKTPL
ncbi:MAG TPA: alpha/beta hydrolase [Pseudolabrys sp.]